MIKIKNLFSKLETNNSTSVKRRLSSLAIPIFIETLLIMMLGAVDTVMLSRYSDDSVAAVGVVNQIVMLCFLVFEVINLGTSVLCAQYIGAGLKDRLVKVVGVSLIVNLAIGILVSSVLFFFDDSILDIMGLGDRLLPYGTVYLKIVGAFAFCQAISMTLSAALRAANHAVYPMMVTFVINILNIIGNYTLIFGKFGMPAMGVEGAAISTVLCRGGAMIMLFVILTRVLISRFPIKDFRPFPWRELRNMLKIGMPSAGEQLSYSSSQVVITFFINMISVEALATRTYCVNIIMFSYLFCIAIAQGGAICIGHLVGSGKNNAAFVLGKYVLKKAVAITFLISIVIAIFGHVILSWLTDNPEIIALGVVILWIDVLLEIGRPINIFAVNALRAAGDANFPFYVGLIVMWSVAVIGGYFVGITLGFGIIGMWWAFTLDENIRGAIFGHRWYDKKWQNKGFVTR